MNARSKPSRFSDSTLSRSASTATALMPLFSSDSCTFLPLHSDTSRSADQPPMSTATRPKTLGSVMRLFMTRLAHDAHLGNELDAGALAHDAADVLDQALDVRGGRARAGDDEVRVQRRHF